MPESLQQIALHRFLPYKIYFQTPERVLQSANDLIRWLRFPSRYAAMPSETLHFLWRIRS
ncbi:hypothetical protein NEIPOLOT_01332 [Neisseria polysaccharea ATCC 43768]|nr:hypothetical protein NEIPOLOT_01332 [Neisseria polysaccharea ATCC 43768]